MRKIKLRLPKFILIPVAACIVGLAGCTSVQVNPNTVGSYEFGELQVIVETDVDHLYLAAKAGISDDGLFLTGDDWRGTSATLTARDEVDTRVTVRLKQVEPGQTSIGIRYGIAGDLHQAQNLFTRIEKRLATTSVNRATAL